MPKNEIIYQPELSTFMFYGLGILKLTDYVLWNKFIKREAFIRAFNNMNPFYFNQFMIQFEDGLMNYALYRNAKSFYITEKVGYYYFLNNTISIQRKVPKNERIKCFFLYINFIIENSKNLKKEKDMALFIYRHYPNRVKLIKFADKYYNLYESVLYFFLNYDYISQKGKNKIRHFLGIIKKK